MVRLVCVLTKDCAGPEKDVVLGKANDQGLALYMRSLDQ